VIELARPDILKIQNTHMMPVAMMRTDEIVTTSFLDMLKSLNMMHLSLCNVRTHAGARRHDSCCHMHYRHIGEKA
jgi:hypothetical protein